jgi:hypothetical protein
MAVTLTIVDKADGTGATATIAGSTGTNTVYAQDFGGDLGTGLWVSKGTRSGDGTVSLSLAVGHYFAYVSGAAVSPVVYKRIRDAVVARLKLLGLAGIVNKNIVGREIRIQRDLALPCCVVSYGTPSMDLRAGVLSLDEVVYPIDVAFFDKDNESHDKDGTYTLWEEKAAKGFRNQRLTGVSEVFNCAVTPGPAIDFEAWKSNEFLGALTLKFSSRESRGI